MTQPASPYARIRDTRLNDHDYPDSGYPGDEELQGNDVEDYDRTSPFPHTSDRETYE